MKVYAHDGTEEQNILIAMIVSDRVLGRVSNIWTGSEGPFSSHYSNIVGGMCVRYFKQYQKAPRKDIEHILRAYGDGKDKDTVELLDSLLTQLSGRYEQIDQDINPDFSIDQAAKLFTRIKLIKTADSIKAAIDTGRLDQAEEAYRDFRKPDLGPAADLSVFTDEDSWRQAIKTNERSVVEYPGALGAFFRNSLARGNFVAFMGPPKRGKTWFLLDIAWTAALQRKRVAFLEIGDMTQDQIIRRFMVRAAGVPLSPKKVKIPYSISADKLGVYVKHREVEFNQGLNYDAAVSGFEKAIRYHIRSKNPYLKLRCYPAASVSIEMIANMIDDWCQADWIPDVIVIDYADILAMSSGSDEFRHKTNMNWMGLRGISTKGCQPLVVTATQGNRASFTAGTISMEHTSEDMRKLAQVTGIVGISSKPEEKADGITRLNWTPLREDEYNSKTCVCLAQCLALGNPAMLSCFPDQEEKQEEDSTTQRNGNNRIRNGRHAETNGNGVEA